MMLLTTQSSQFFSAKVAGVYEFGKFCKKVDEYQKKAQNERDGKSIIQCLEGELYSASGSIERDYELDEKIDTEAFEQLLSALKLDQSTAIHVVSAKSMVDHDSRGLSSSDNYPNTKNMIERAIRKNNLSEVLSKYFVFENNKIKEKVISIIMANWSRSEVFQDMVITMFNFAERRTNVPGMGKAFIGEGEESSSIPGRIYLKGEHYLRSAFPGSDLPPMRMSEDLVFFHEAGHSVDYNFVFFNGIDSTFGIFGKNMEKWDESGKLDLKPMVNFYNVVAKFIPTKLDEAALNSSDDLIIKVNEKSGAKKLLSLPEARSKILFDQITEVWQILGVAYIRCGNVSSLYVNAMSDLALCLDMELPIRIDHRGGTTAEDCSRYEYIKFDKFNIKLYKALFELLGSSLEKYLNKLEKNAEKDKSLRNYVKELRV